MKGGFARARITPPVGTTMAGFADRDAARGCETIHDDLFARALYLSDAGEQVLIVGFDLLFLARQDADRLKGAIGRRIDLTPRQIVLNASHTHAGPSVGTWYYAGYQAPDRAYLDDLVEATVSAALGARDAACEVTLWAGATRSALPVSRRKLDAGGKARFQPNPAGTVCDSLPVCLLKGPAGRPVCLLFSVSCHPSIIKGHAISADYPGVAMQRLDVQLHRECSLFLQGAGGDAKPCVVVADERRWRYGSWDDVAESGAMVADEVIEALEAGLVEVEPRLRASAAETSWPLGPCKERSEYAGIAADPETDDLRRMWAERQVALIDSGRRLPSSAPITVHGVQIGEGLRLVGVEGELVAGLGLLIRDFYKDGVTFPLGYTDGAQLYLPTSGMLCEGGYEVGSFYEYGFPAPLAAGTEGILTGALEQLRAAGVE